MFLLSVSTLPPEGADPMDIKAHSLLFITNKYLKLDIPVGPDRFSGEELEDTGKKVMKGIYELQSKFVEEQNDK